MTSSPTIFGHTMTRGDDGSVWTAPFGGFDAVVGSNGLGQVCFRRNFAILYSERHESTDAAARAVEAKLRELATDLAPALAIT